MKTKTPELGPNPRIRELIPLLWRRMGSSRLLFVLAVLFCSGDLVVQMLIPYILGIYFNILESGELARVTSLLILFNIALISLNALGILGHYLKQNNVSILHRTITMDLVDNAQRLPLEKAQASHSADLSQRIMWDSNKVT